MISNQNEPRGFKNKSLERSCGASNSKHQNPTKRSLLEDPEIIQKIIKTPKNVILKMKNVLWGSRMRIFQMFYALWLCRGHHFQYFVSNDFQFFVIMSGTSFPVLCEKWYTSHGKRWHLDFVRPYTVSIVFWRMWPCRKAKQIKKQSLQKWVLF